MTLNRFYRIVKFEQMIDELTIYSLHCNMKNSAPIDTVTIPHGHDIKLNSFSTSTSKIHDNITEKR